MCGGIQPKILLFMKVSLNLKSIFLSRSFKTCCSNWGQGTSESSTWRWHEGVVTANNCDPDDFPPHTVPAWFSLFAPLSIYTFSVISPQDTNWPSCVKNDMVIKCFVSIFKGNFLCFGFVYLTLTSFIPFRHCVLKNMSNFRDKSPTPDYRAGTHVHIRIHKHIHMHRSVALSWFFVIHNLSSISFCQLCSLFCHMFIKNIIRWKGFI